MSYYEYLESKRERKNILKGFLVLLVFVAVVLLFFIGLGYLISWMRQ